MFATFAPMILWFAPMIAAFAPMIAAFALGIFSKTHQSSLTLKGGSTSHLGLLPSGKKRKPLLLVARNHFILWLADHQRSSPAAELRFAVCDRMDTNRLQGACPMLDAYCLLDAGCLMSAHSMLAGAGDCCQGLFGEFLGQHVLEEEGVAEDVTTPHAAGLFQETVEPFETVVLPP